MATKFSELDPADPLVGTEIVAVSQLDGGVLTSKKATVADIAGLAGGGSADQVSYDNSTSGLTATDVQDALDEIKSEVDSIPSGGGASSADQVSYDNSTSGLTATDVQDAIDEIKSEVDSIPSGGGASSADQVSYDNSTSGLTATDVQDAIDEIKAEVDSIPSGGGASAADQVSYDNSTSGLTATDVQDAIDEVQVEKVAKSGDTIEEVTLVEYTETVVAGGTALDPSSGTIQTYTMASNTTFTDAMSDGQNLTLHLSGGGAYAATWPTITWVGGSAPVLSSDDVLQFWKVGGVLFGAYVGSIA